MKITKDLPASQHNRDKEFIKKKWYNMILQMEYNIRVFMSLHKDLRTNIRKNKKIRIWFCYKSKEYSLLKGNSGLLHKIRVKLIKITYFLGHLQN